MNQSPFDPEDRYKISAGVSAVSRVPVFNVKLASNLQGDRHIAGQRTIKKGFHWQNLSYE